MSVADNVKKVGEVVTYIGIACAFVMLVVGTVAIDIVILAALLKDRENRNNGFDSFVTGMLFGMMFSSNSRDLYSNAGMSLLLSPITTGIAIALSFFLGVPAVGIGLALGWAGVAVTVGLGLMIYRIGELIESYGDDDGFGVTVEHGTGTATTYGYFADHGMGPGVSRVTAPANGEDFFMSTDGYSYPQDPLYTHQAGGFWDRATDSAEQSGSAAYWDSLVYPPAPPAPVYPSAPPAPVYPFDPPTYDDVLKSSAPTTTAADEYRGRFYPPASAAVYPSAPPPPSVGQYPQYQPY